MSASTRDTDLDMSTIEKGKKVTIRYVLRDDRNFVLESSPEGGETYVHGKTAIVPGLERGLTGRSAGDQFELVVPPKDGYGLRARGPGAQPIPRSTFPDNAQLTVGMPFEAAGPGGAPIKLFVSRIEGGQVFVDTSHPYAGATLHFEVEVLAVE